MVLAHLVLGYKRKTTVIREALQFKCAPVDLRSAWHAQVGGVSTRYGLRPRYYVNGSRLVSRVRQQREELRKFG